MKVFQFMGYAKWWGLSKVGRKKSLINTTIIHFGCNLRCKHCSVVKETEFSHMKLSYDEIVSDMQKRFDAGARIMYFEGGETTLWKDGDKTLGDLISKSKEIGYHNTGYTTNGTGTFYTNSDVIAVSLDGTKDVHNTIRGEGVFETLFENLDKLEFDGSIYANMVIQRDNLDNVVETIELVKSYPKIKGVMINFITPPPNDITIDPEEKKKIVDQLFELKSKGYPILNSKKGLKYLAIDDWSKKCPTYMTHFFLPGGHVFKGCPLAGTDACKRCGFAAAREYYLVNRGDPSTIVEISSLFAMSK